jgi:hypothetical protein
MNAPSPPAPHPLAADLVIRYRQAAWSDPVIEIAAGSGRNSRYLTDAGIPLVSTRDDETFTQLPGGRNRYAAALSTHGYLHGTFAKLRLGFAELRRVLRPAAPIYITLGSVDDSRFGFGTAVDEYTFAPGDGDEAGIPHAYFDRAGVKEVLAPAFTVESLDEMNVDEIVGRWAHEGPSGMRHWLVVARRNEAAPLPADANQ